MNYFWLKDIKQIGYHNYVKILMNLCNNFIYKYMPIIFKDS
jgi:hypothetical protein